VTCEGCRVRSRRVNDRQTSDGGHGDG
jgi:hypothetical protein